MIAAASISNRHRSAGPLPPSAASISISSRSAAAKTPTSKKTALLSLAL
jgi:hypothetical protein